MQERVGVVEPLEIELEERPKPNDRIKVRCTRCREIFYREYKRLGQLHRCPTHKKNYKWCNGCKTYAPMQEFDKNQDRYDKLATYCIGCIDRLKSEINSLIILNKWGLTTQDVLEQWDKQGGRDYHTRRHLNGLDWSIKILNSELGYVRGNIYITDKEQPTDCIRDDISPVRLEAKLISGKGKIPSRKRTTDAGYDVYSTEEVVISPHSMKNISTGVIVSCPEGYYITVEGRSSMWIRGVTPFHGIIDSTYCGELMIALMNISDEPYHVKYHDRIAQIIIQRYCNVDIVEVDEFGPDYDQRGVAGFGSSGK